MSSSLVHPFSEEYRDSALTARQTYRFISSENIGLITGMIDCLLIVTSSVFSAIAYHYIVLQGPIHVTQYVGIGSVSALIFISLATSRNLYKIHSLELFFGRSKENRVTVVSSCGGLHLNIVLI